MDISNKQLKAFIEDAGLVDKDKLDKFFKEAEKKGEQLDKFLLKKEALTGEQMAQLRAYISGIPFVDLEKENIPTEVLKIIPEPIARKHQIVAYKKTGNKLEVAMLDPDDLQTIDFIRKKANLKIQPRLTTEESIKHVLKQYQESLEKEFEGIIEKTPEGKVEVEAVAGKEAPEAEELKEAAAELPIIRIVDTILRQAISQRATDIHIEPEENDVLVRYRIDGILHDTLTLPKNVQDGIVARIKILSDLRLDEHRLPQDGRFTIKSPDYKVSFRVSILPVFDGEKVVMRLLHEGAKGFTLEELGFWGENMERLQKAIHKPQGFILVTGPTGSGKTTTLYTALDIINTPEINISTIEDPIEYRMPRINQTQVKPDIGMTFSNGLRSLVRQDPDVILVGEIRDSETANLAINAALTGHLVMATLHTNSAAGAIPRLRDMDQEPFLLSSTIILVEAQRLVRQVCPDTRKEKKLDKKELKSLGEEVDLDRMLQLMRDNKVIGKNDTWNDVTFYEAVPSDDCPDGYRDRIGIHEVMEVTESIKELITSNATSDDIQRRAIEEGMHTMLEDGIVKAARGITTIEEVLRVTRE